MGLLIGVKWKCFINQFTEKYRWIVGLLAVTGVILYGQISYILQKVLRNVVVNDANFLIAGCIIVGIAYIMIVSIPGTVYDSYTTNRKYDIIFMAPISLHSCFLWSYLSLLCKILVAELIIGTLIIPGLFDGVILFKYTVFIAIMTIMILSVITMIILLSLYYGGKQACKSIMIFTAIAEIAAFFGISSLSDGGKVFSEAITVLTKRIIDSNTIIIMFTISTIAYWVSYMIFRKMYYRDGTFYDTGNLVDLKEYKKVNFKRLYFYGKDIKITIRNISRLKYIFVTLAVCFYTTLSQSADSISGIIVVSIIISIILSAQFICDGIGMEQGKSDIFLLRGITGKEFVKQKSMYGIINTMAVMTIYDVILIIASKEYMVLPIILLINFILIKATSVIIIKVWNIILKRFRRGGLYG